MNVLLETAFDRLLSRYERTFGEAPPFTAATAEEAIEFMRRRLRDANAERAVTPPAWIASATSPAGGPAVNR